MKFSEQWLRTRVDPAVSTDELVELLTMAGLEVDSVERLDGGLSGSGVGEVLGRNDAVIEIDLTPNRGDCLGLEGIAREVGALTQSPLAALHIPVVTPGSKDSFPVDVQAPVACPRYLGRVIRAVNGSAQTPRWMQERLSRSGIRSLGPLVDVTNYVLLELGQPMHAFDLAQLSGGIQVRHALCGETLTLLDERVVSLDTETLIIADHDRPLAIAGVMGGLASGVSAATQDLFLECAFFAPEAIAGCARRYAMHTDSAHRFERGVDPQLQSRALERATGLLLEICGGVAGPVTECLAREHLPAREPIHLRKTRIRRLLGVLPDAGEVSGILARLGMTIDAQDEDGWRVLPPSFRFDINIESDLIEEIGRIYGYNRLPSVSIRGNLDLQPLAETARSIEQYCDLLVARGYQEAVTYSFVDPQLQQCIDPQHEAVQLANPISSEMAAMRTSLWPGLLKAVQYNINRQKPRVRFFEHGLRFWRDAGVIRQEPMLGGVVTGTRLPEHWDGKGDAVGFYDLKQDVQSLLQLTGRAFRYVTARHPALHPGQSASIQLDGRTTGWLGRIHPQLAQQLDLDPSTCVFELEYAALCAGRLACFAPISRFPSIRRDLAVVVDEKISAAAVQDVVREAAGPLLRELVNFDVYRGKGVESGRKSIALGLILQDNSRTLTEQEIESVVSRVTGRLGVTLGATLRD